MDFSNNKHLEAALKKNKQKLLGKKVSIARSDPSKSKKSREAGPSSIGHGTFFAQLKTLVFTVVLFENCMTDVMRYIHI